MHDVLRNIWTGLTTASPLDQANLVLGILGVALMIGRSLWAFPVGLVAVTVQSVLFYRATFYADATVQGFFFVALAYGWWHWVVDRGQTAELPVTTLSWANRALVLLLVGVGTAVWAVVEIKYTDTKVPWRDAFIAALSVAGQWLQSRKKLENWPVWVVANIVAIASYWKADLAYTAFLYAVYLVMAFLGWRAWHRAMQKETSHA